MARISGVDLPREKRIEIALTYIFGIGVPSARKILAATGVNPDVRVKKSIIIAERLQHRRAADGTPLSLSW